jgi:hypothetical protein
MDDWEKLLDSIELDQAGIISQIRSIGSIFNIVLAIIAGFSILSVYFLIYRRRKLDPTLTYTIPVLTILMTVLMRIEGGKIAVFFGIFGVLSIVRFRSVLNEQKDIAFVLFSIIMGVLIGVGNYLLSLFTFVAVIIVIIVLMLIEQNGLKNRKTIRLASVLIKTNGDLVTTQTAVKHFLDIHKIDFKLLAISGKSDPAITEETLKTMEYEIAYTDADDLVNKLDKIHLFAHEQQWVFEMKKVRNLD